MGIHNYNTKYIASKEFISNTSPITMNNNHRAGFQDGAQDIYGPHKGGPKDATSEFQEKASKKSIHEDFNDKPEKDPKLFERDYMTEMRDQIAGKSDYYHG